MAEMDIYPVGLLMDWRRRRHIPLRRTIKYVARQVTARNWRAVRNYFNGYLAEHRHPCAHNAGKGWTKRAARRRADLICAATPAPRTPESADERGA